jgi:Kdo2-lipid IVA lauroyltransferase/acyltransferase
MFLVGNFPYNNSEYFLNFFNTFTKLNAMTHQNSNFKRLINFVSRQPLSVTRFFARFLAFLVNTFKLTKTSNIIHLNLNIALPELSHEKRREIAETAIRNELTSYFEFFHIWGANTEKNIASIEHIHNEHLLHEALNAQKGLILIVPHFGTWEIMNAWVAQHTKMTIMYKPIKNQSADDFVREARSREQANLVPTDESGVRQIFKALKQGGTTVVLPDHTPDFSGELIPYFGIPLISSSLSAKLIQKTKAKALFLTALRNENGKFDMYIDEISSDIYTQTAEQGTETIHQKLEDLIRQNPENYHWSYKRFSANPKLHRIYNMPLQDALILVDEVRQEALTKPNHAESTTL